MNYKLLKKIIITGKIKAETGLAIGGSNTAMGIGGVDKGVIRNPVNNQPYIPGSSFKGKMRSLLELVNGTVGDKAMGAIKNGPCEEDGARSAKLFGTASNTDFEQRITKKGYQHASRIIVRDCFLSKDQGGKSISDFFKGTDLLYTEVKTEVVIDRITSKAMPRQMERVPAGATFDFELVINFFEGRDKNGVDKDDETAMIQDVFSALQLVQNDYIGGSGSRGSGQVSFKIEQIVERSNAFYLGKSPETNLTNDYKSRFPK
jgi:CRISPR-associated protein Csm3